MQKKFFQTLLVLVGIGFGAAAFDSTDTTTAAAGPRHNLQGMRTQLAKEFKELRHLSGTMSQPLYDGLCTREGSTTKVDDNGLDAEFTRMSTTFDLGVFRMEDTAYASIHLTTLEKLKDEVGSTIASAQEILGRIRHTWENNPPAMWAYEEHMDAFINEMPGRLTSLAASAHMSITTALTRTAAPTTTTGHRPDDTTALGIFDEEDYFEAPNHRAEDD